MKVNNYRDLLVWQKAIDYTVKIYGLTKKFPHDEKFVLTSQMNRAAVSIPSNIAEGAGRSSRKEFVNFLSIALGSCYEVETQLTIAQKIGYVALEDTTTLSECSVEIQKMIFGLRKSLLGKTNDSNLHG